MLKKVFLQDSEFLAQTWGDDYFLKRNMLVCTPWKGCTYSEVEKQINR
jgi:hypothetical protein